MTVSRSLGYRPGLDGVRALAIGLVLLNHTGLRVFEGGSNGVIVFFVLSGFLITKLMIEEWERTDGISLSSFYGRRAVRILPAPTVMLLVLLALRGVITDSELQARYVLREIVLSAIYLTNMKPLLMDDLILADGSVFPGYLGHMWSLAVEEQFYLVWPIAMISLALAARPGREVIRVIVAIAAAIAVVRLGIYYLPFSNPDLASISLFSFDGFALGAALAFAVHSGAAPALERVLAQTWVPVAGVAVLVADLLLGSVTHDLSSLYVVYCSIASAAIIGHLFVAPDSPATQVAALPAAVFIGKLSYSIYLWHNPIWVYFNPQRFPDWSRVALVGAELGLTVVAVLSSYYAVEKPAMRLRKHFAH